MPDVERVARALLDTSAVIDADLLPIAAVPLEAAISALTLAELAAAPGATNDPAERARRQEVIQRVEATFSPLPFDVAAARAYGRVASAILAAGRKARGTRAVDLLIAATALANDLPLVTRNGADLVGLGDLLEIIEV